jgi:hypothetical protein
MFRGKIIVVGLNKSGSTTMHRALTLLGYRSAHHRRDDGRYIHQIIAENASHGRPLLDSLEDYDAISDWMSHADALDHYKQLDQQYPNTRFILLERDPSSWLDSREKHVLRNRANPDYRGGWTQVDRQVWARKWHQYLDDIRYYFRDRPGDFLIMHVTTGEGWEKLCPFLETPAPPTPFPHSNASEAPTKRIKRSCGLFDGRSSQLLFSTDHSATTVCL